MGTDPSTVDGIAQPDEAIFVLVEDGRVAVYVSASLADADVKILDKDDAKLADDAVWLSTLQRIAEVAKRCTQIY